SPKSELVMFMFTAVRMRLVVHVNCSRSIHFKRKLQRLISKRSGHCKARNFEFTRENARWSPGCVMPDFHVGSEHNTRAIIHLDMDCFYAAIEVRDRPSLRGKPVGVGGARERRGVLTTCNYEARKFGVRSAMPTFMALQRCPNLIVLPTRFDVYRR